MSENNNFFGKAILLKAPIPQTPTKAALQVFSKLNVKSTSILTLHLSPELKGRGPDAGVGGNPEREVCLGTLLRLQNNISLIDILSFNWLYLKLNKLSKPRKTFSTYINMQ